MIVKIVVAGGGIFPSASLFAGELKIPSLMALFKRKLLIRDDVGKVLRYFPGMLFNIINGLCAFGKKWPCCLGDSMV